MTSSGLLPASHCSWPVSRIWHSCSLLTSSHDFVQNSPLSSYLAASFSTASSSTSQPVTAEMLQSFIFGAYSVCASYLVRCHCSKHYHRLRFPKFSIEHRPLPWALHFSIQLSTRGTHFGGANEHPNFNALYNKFLISPPNSISVNCCSTSGRGWTHGVVPDSSLRFTNHLQPNL